MIDNRETLDRDLSRRRREVKVRVAPSDMSRPAYIGLLTVYLGFAAFAAYEIAVTLSSL